MVGKLATVLAAAAVCCCAAYVPNAQAADKSPLALPPGVVMPAPVSAPESADAPPAETRTAIAIMQVDAALAKGDCPRALPLLTQLWDDPVVQAQDPALAEKYRDQRVVCTRQTRDVKAAVTLSAENLAHAGAGIDSYDLHAILLLADNRPDDAAATLDTAVSRFPADAAKLSDQSVIGTLMALQDKNADATPPLLDHLEQTRWQTKNVTLRYILDYMRLSGLRAAVARGDQATADRYRADLSGNTMLYILIQGDGALTSPATPPQAIKPILSRQIGQVGTYVAAHPNELFTLEYLVTLERMNEDDGAAVIQITSILDLLNSNGLDKFDNPDMLPYLFVSKATLLAEAGKVDQAEATYRDAAARMSGPDLFDFHMSHIDFLIDIGHDKEALDLAGKIDPRGLTEDQRGQLAASLACVYAYTGDVVHYQSALHQTGADGLGSRHAYLCAGDLDNAARALVRDLGDPAQRDSMIAAMQVTLPDIPYSPRTKAYYAALAAIKKRPDVQAAAKAQHINIRSWPLRF